MKLITLDSGGYASNCYLILDENSHTAAVVDPSVGTEDAKKYLSDYTVKYVLLTHGHFDHILCLDKWREGGAKVCIHKDDAELLTDPAKSLYLQFFARDIKHEPADILLSDGDKITLGNSAVSVMHTPGHTAGCVCYIFDDNMISGDTLFAGGVGRTDLYGASASALEQSLRRLASLTVNYKVFPGHGEPTTIMHEKEYGYLAM